MKEWQKERVEIIKKILPTLGKIKVWTKMKKTIL